MNALDALAEPIDGSGDVGRVARRTERAPENAKPEARGGIAYRRIVGDGQVDPRACRVEGASS